VKKKNKTKVNAYLKYSGIAFQLFFLLFITAYAGQWVDARLGNKRPYLTAFLLIFVLGGYLYKLVKDLEKDK